MMDAVRSVNELTETTKRVPLEVEDEVIEVIHELVNRVSLWYDPLTAEMDFYSLDYRKAPSMASASTSGSELGDLSDSELPVLESDEDSDKEFEKLLSLSYEMRVKTLKKEHPDFSPQQKQLKEEKKIDKSDLHHEYDNLPPLENLSIHCEESIPLEPVGEVTSVVDCLVVIQSNTGVALDLDSILFDKDRNSIGAVFDLFGPVRCPLYSVRYNTREEAAKFNVGMQVYYAPTAEQYTKKVIEKYEESKLPCEDAASDDEVVFSDDEKEKEYLMQKASNRPANQSQRRGQKRRVQFSEPSVQRGRGADRGHRGRGSSRGNAWNWHSERGHCPSRRQTSSRARGQHVKFAPKQASGSTGNPYAEYGCYGSTSFADTRQI